MRILLTGPGGFLGAALAQRLLGDGHHLTALARPQSNLVRIAALADRLDVARAVTEADLFETVTSARPEVIIHTACAYGRAGESAVALIDANLRLGVGLLEAASRLQDRTVSFFNTASVLEPTVSPYALSKQQFADWGRQFAATSGGALQFVNLRLQHMYGPGDAASKFTTHVIRSCVAQLPRLALTPGEQRRDFVYIDDVVEACLVLLENRATLAGHDEVDIGSGQAPPVRDFVETVKRLTQSSTGLDFGALPYRPNEAMSCRADLRRLAALGWTPAFSQERGILKTIEIEQTT